jgi:hypothetical protein
VLGEEIEVERVEHVLAGGRRCAYSIRDVQEFRAPSSKS